MTKEPDNVKNLMTFLKIFQPDLIKMKEEYKVQVVDGELCLGSGEKVLVLDLS